jgi:hypothetical protein
MWAGPRVPSGNVTSVVFLDSISAAAAHVGGSSGAGAVRAGPGSSSPRRRCMRSRSWHGRSPRWRRSPSSTGCRRCTPRRSSASGARWVSGRTSRLSRCTWPWCSMDTSACAASSRVSTAERSAAFDAPLLRVGRETELGRGPRHIRVSGTAPASRARHRRCAAGRGAAWRALRGGRMRMRRTSCTRSRRRSMPRSDRWSFGRRPSHP